MSDLLNKISCGLLCASPRDTDSPESEVDDTMILPRRMPVERNTRPVEPINSAVSSHPRPVSKNTKIAVGKKSKDPYRRRGGKDESTLIIDPGSHFPEQPVEESDDEEFNEQILPENLANGQPIPEAGEPAKQLSITADTAAKAAAEADLEIAAEQPPAGAPTASDTESLAIPQRRARPRSQPPSDSGLFGAPGSSVNPDSRRNALYLPGRRDLSPELADAGILTSDDLLDFLQSQGVAVGPRT